MKRMIAVALLSAIAVSACGDSSPPSAPGGVSEASPESPEPACEALPLNEIKYPKGSPVLRDGQGTVPAQANIFAAGRDAAPAPGSGGAGVLPPVVLLPAGSSRVVTFPSVTGRITHWVQGTGFNGAAGDGIGPIDVRSLQGISGIVQRNNRTFLVGVFLTDTPPSNPAPPRLDFSVAELESAEAVWVPDGEGFGELAPEIGQTFFIGDGKGHSFRVPAEATRLFLGFADARLWVGCPGWYGNNEGELTVTVDVAEG